MWANADAQSVAVIAAAATAAIQIRSHRPMAFPNARKPAEPCAVPHKTWTWAP
jgi:hypothetical protein